MPSSFYPLAITFLLFSYFKEFFLVLIFTNLTLMWYSYLYVCFCVCVYVCGVYTVCGMVSFLHLWVSSNLEKFWPLFLGTIWVLLLSSQLLRCQLYVCWTAWNFPCFTETLFIIFSVSFSLCFILNSSVAVFSIIHLSRSYFLGGRAFF